MSIKMLREHLCFDQARWQAGWPRSVRLAVRLLIRLVDHHRPLGSNGKHGDRHTATCGCGESA
jgi:hypothetical protein